MPIETERLILRDWEDDDFPAFLAHTNTPAVMRWLGGVRDEAHGDEMCKALAAMAPRDGFAFRAVLRKADGGHLAGEILGFCGLTRSHLAGGPIGEFEIGWRLREDAWGHGYAREAAQASLEAAFRDHGAPHVLALTVIENEASWGLMRRIGMTRRADLDFAFAAPPDAAPASESGRAAKREAIIAYRITREEWEAHQ